MNVVERITRIAAEVACSEPGCTSEVMCERHGTYAVCAAIAAQGNEALQAELAQFARDRADLYMRACKAAADGERWAEAAKWESSSHAVTEIAQEIERWGKPDE